MNSFRRTQALRAPRTVVPLAARSQTRYFHPTRPTRLINEALDASTNLIHGIHNSTGLPWVASIPLTALLVRTGIALPLQIFTRTNARREADISPLILATQRLYHTRGKANGWTKDRVQNVVNQRASLLRSKWKIIPGYQLVNFVQIPVWISIMESLRGMCGSKNGIMPWILSWIEPEKDVTAHLESLHLTPEPSLANEGSLWFPDLLAGDPTSVLPCLLTASILLNIRTGWNMKTFGEISDLPDLQMYQQTVFRGLRVFVQLLALNVGLSGVAYEMPVALMIYWITSTNVATLQTWFLNKYLFKSEPPPLYTPRYVGYKGTGDPFKLKLR
ncbi:uncharacterized protein N7459_004998 [Penicillium hispanicum]|uniref:uncharacterized protein n=1 Tax=Penicillium hispanicum TaxID=1080232 RepID=UPI00254188A5|nr:uncharacterized protein N7459_004998 [Penicillium hispanicum]KAJ5585198.1 hypothetical protein N7459_004998 [Penicillium hispanicum]